MEGGSLFVKLGSCAKEYDENFKLYMITNITNP